MAAENPQARPRHGNHRAGWLVPGRGIAREWVRWGALVRSSTRRQPRDPARRSQARFL